MNNLGKKKTILTVLPFSCILALIIVFQGKIFWDGNIFCSWKPELFDEFSLKDIFVFILTLCSILFILCLISKYIERVGSFSANTNRVNKSYFFIPAICSFFSFFIFLINYFPGVVLPDSLQTMYQGVSGEPFYNQHPVVYSIFVGLIVRFGNLLINYTFGILLYSLIQMAIMSGVIGYLIYWLAKRNIPTSILVIIWMYYSLSGIFSVYSVTMWKDPLFSCFLLLLMLKQFEIMCDSETFGSWSVITKLLCLIWLIAFFRTNGVFVIVAISILLTLIFHSYKKQIGLVWLNVVLILMIQGPGYRMAGIVTPITESIGVPLQQISYIICEEGNITDEEYEYLNSVLSMEEWKEKYHPFLVDELKANVNSEVIISDKVRFYKTWIAISLRNLPLAIQAHAIETYGFWSIGTKNDYGFYENTIVKPNIYNVAQTNKCEEILGLNLRSLYSNIVFPDSGIFFILLLMSTFLLLVKRKYSFLLSLSPAWLCWLSVMLATPVAFSLRYVFIIPFSCPFILLLPFMDSQKSVDKDL